MIRYIIFDCFDALLNISEFDWEYSHLVGNTKEGDGEKKRFQELGAQFEFAGFGVTIYEYTCRYVPVSNIHV